MQKEMFLLLKETGFSSEREYNFISHYSGLFSRDLDSDLIKLVISSGANDNDGYVLTPAGFRDAQILWNELDQTHKMALLMVKEKYNRLTPDNLLD